MDINDLRSLFTVVTFAVFMAIVLWAWSGRRHGEFHAAALLPFDDDITPLSPRGRGAGGEGAVATPSSPSPIKEEGTNGLRKI